MPLYKTFDTDDYHISVWKHAECDSFDYERILTKEEKQKIEQMPTKKRWERIMIRQLLSQILPNTIIQYEENGNPYLLHSDKKISISHSYPYAVLAISDEPIGVDLEKISDKILRVKEKFLHEEEKKWIGEEFSPEILTAIWSMKEALYKVHPSKLWSLKKYYWVHPFQLNSKPLGFGQVFNEERNDTFVLEWLRIEDYFLTIARNEK